MYYIFHMFSSNDSGDSGSTHVGHSICKFAISNKKFYRKLNDSKHWQCVDGQWGYINNIISKTHASMHRLEVGDIITIGSCFAVLTEIRQAMQQTGNFDENGSKKSSIFTNSHEHSDFANSDIITTEPKVDQKDLQTALTQAGLGISDMEFDFSRTIKKNKEDLSKYTIAKATATTDSKKVDNTNAPGSLSVVEMSWGEQGNASKESSNSKDGKNNKDQKNASSFDFPGNLYE